MAFSLVQRSPKYQSAGLGAVTQTYSAGLANFGTGNRLLVSPFAHYSSVGSEQITSVAYNTSDAATERVERQNPVNVNNQFTIFDRLSVSTGGAHDTSLTFAQAGAPDGHYPTGNTSEWSYSGTCTSEGTATADGNDTAPTISIAVQAGDLVIGGFVLADASNFTVTSSPAGATVEWSEGTVTSFEGGEAVSIIAASTGTLTLTWGMSVSQRWSAAIAVYRDSGSGGPTIDTQPSNAHVHVGATATFTVAATASGGGTLSYQWKKNGTNVSGGSGGTSASYTTPTLTAADDQASYTCDVTETGGSSDGTATSSAATLRVGVIHIAAGTIAYSASGGTSVAPGYPAGVAANDLLVMVLGQKPSSANGGTATTPASPWSLDGSRTGANDGDTGGYTTTLGADTGNCNIFAYSVVATGSESGTLSVTVGTNNVCWAQMLLFRAPPSATWSVSATTGKDTSAGNLSITGAADPGVDAGDYVVAGVVIPTDVTTPAQFSAEAFSQTGVGFGTVVEFSEPDSTTGNDIGGVIFGAPVSTGPSSAAPVATATVGGTNTNVRGPGVLVRLRAAAAGSPSPEMMGRPAPQQPMLRQRRTLMSPAVPVEYVGLGRWKTIGASAATTGGDGSSAISVTVAAGGAAISAGTGASAATVTANAAGASVAAGGGSCSVAVTASGAGSLIGAGAGASSIAVTASGVGSTVAAGVGAAAIACTAAAVGTGVNAAAGSGAATLACAAVGASSHAGVGVCSATVSVAAVGSSVAATAGACSVVLTASGSAEAGSVGSCSLTVTVSGTGEALKLATGAAAVALTTAASGSSVAAGAGSSSLTLSASAGGSGIAAAAGSATATCTVTGAGSAVSAAAGSASVTVSASGAGQTLSGSSASGTVQIACTIAGVGSSVAAASGASSLSIAAAAVGSAVTAAVGSASLTCTAAAVGAGLLGSSGSCSLTLTAAAIGSVIASGAGSVGLAVTGSAAATSTAASAGASSINLTVSGASAPIFPDDPPSVTTWTRGPAPAVSTWSVQSGRPTATWSQRDEWLLLAA